MLQLQMAVFSWYSGFILITWKNKRVKYLETIL